MVRKGSKKPHKFDRARQKQDRHVARILLQRRICRQMLDQLLFATYKLQLPTFAGMTRERVTEMRQIFSPKTPIGTSTRIRAADSRRRAAGVADLKAALNYVNTYGLRMKQHEDGSYEQGVADAETDTTDDHDEDNENEESNDDSGEGEAEEKKVVVEEQEDSEMADITTRTRRLKLVFRPKKDD